jgi:2-polyprenyl-3-methyl-5-hydroxy-6-metoxy-1,4-benzoquinol methylase
MPAGCILCGISPDRQVYRNGSWQYYQCRHCGLVTLHPRPSADEVLSAYDTYLPVNLDEIHGWQSMITPVVDVAAELVLDNTKTDGTRLLDIGCGYGFFLKKMAQLGWKVEGLEVSGPGRDYARQELGLCIHSKPLEAMAFPSEHFDAVTLFYVIEHVLDPALILNEVYRILKPNGILLLRWPHSTPIVKLLGPLAKKFDIYHTPFHLYDFNPKAMGKLVEQAGFTAVQNLIGGITLPKKKWYRFCSILFGHLAQGIYRISAGRLLLPGVSKTTIAYK